MKITGKHRTAMRRKIVEWIKIAEEAGRNETMNSKNDWNAEAMPCVVVEGEKDEEKTEKKRKREKECEKNEKGKTTKVKNMRIDEMIKIGEKRKERDEDRGQSPPQRIVTGQITEESLEV